MLHFQHVLAIYSVAVIAECHDTFRLCFLYPRLSSRLRSFCTALQLNFLACLATRLFIPTPLAHHSPGWFRMECSPSHLHDQIRPYPVGSG
jgi:hypothetical protein